MRATNKTLLELGNNEIPISFYSAIEKETSFNQISKCCNQRVNYSKVCSICRKTLTEDDIYKALEVGGEYKAVNTAILKAENTNLKFIGVVEDDSEEIGYIRNGTLSFVTPLIDKKNKSLNERTLLKFSYLHETLKQSKKSFLCAVALRGKEHLLLLKPYKEIFIGVGLYFAEQLRDIGEIKPNLPAVNTATISEMVKIIEEKPTADINLYANKRTELIELALNSDKEITLREYELKAEKEITINPTELLNF